MGVLSKVANRKAVSAISLAILLVGLLIARLKKRAAAKSPDIRRSSSFFNFQKTKANGVDGKFFKDLWRLMKATCFTNGIPRQFLLFNILLVVRSLLTIYISGIKGKVVKAIVSSNPVGFFKQITNMGIVAIPGSFVNSYLEYLQDMIALNLRKGLVQNMNAKYAHGKVFYQVSHVDSRVSGPDQVLTDDIQKWAMNLAELYGDFSKPFLDIILFSRKISNSTSIRGPLLMIGWYLLTGWLIRIISPAFSRYIAELLKREGAFRASHQRIRVHSEEIAFLRGEAAEKRSLNHKFRRLMQLYGYENKLRFLMGILDSTLVKYGAFNVGIAILALPVFGPGKEKYLARVSNDPALIMKDYEQNSSLLVNLAKAIGRIVISYKKVQQLAGSTSRVSHLIEVLDDLTVNGRYTRQLVANKELIHDEALDGCALERGKVWKASDFVKFEQVPIIAPNGDLLLQHLTIKVRTGKSCLIVGPNGSGKTALLRVLAGLWPFFGGKISKVADDAIMFLPQRVYLPRASLRDQITYPHVKSTKSDTELLRLLEMVNLGYLFEREGGFDALNDWYDVLSGGERQRVSVARLFYHCPQFAVIDEATSAVSVEIENTLYLTAKKFGITLITVTQRSTLFRFHDYVLRIKDNKEWEFEEIRHENGEVMH